MNDWMNKSLLHSPIVCEILIEQIIWKPQKCPPFIMWKSLLFKNPFYSSLWTSIVSCALIRVFIVNLVLKSSCCMWLMNLNEKKILIASHLTLNCITHFFSSFLPNDIESYYVSFITKSSFFLWLWSKSSKLFRFHVDLNFA
jgi:hypothetical protein